MGGALHSAPCVVGTPILPAPGGLLRGGGNEAGPDRGCSSIPGWGPAWWGRGSLSGGGCVPSPSSGRSRPRSPPPTVLPSLGHRRPVFPRRLRPCPSGPLCGGVGMWGGAPNPHPEAPAPLRGAIELLLGPRQGGCPEQYSQSWGPDGALGRSCEGRAPWAGGGADPGLLSRPQLAEIGESSRGMTRGAVRRARAPRLAAPRAGLVWGAPLGSCCLPPRGAVTEGPARACSRCPQGGRACQGPGGGLAPHLLADSPPGRPSSRAGPPPDSARSQSLSGVTRQGPSTP